MNLTHLNPQGRARMVDVTGKPETDRMARAVGRIRMKPETVRLINGEAIEKGDVLGVAQVAGVMAAKNTSSLIPMCHPVPLNSVNIEFFPRVEEGMIEIIAEARTTGRTGVEMEALTAVTVAALTVYDMCKSADRWMNIEEIKLVEKSGGKSGHLRREEG